jgi:branched-subunit amino acid aminotransferase/4-amino-4-deoxychorismate lyase
VTWPNNLYNITTLPFVQPKDPYILGIASQTLLHPYSHLKTTAYQLYSNLRKKSILQGYTDMILTTAEGILLETTTANILWYYQNSWYTPARTLPYLKGITLTRLLQQLPNVKEGEFRKQDIHETAQLFVCNSLIGLHPATIIRC